MLIKIMAAIVIPIYLAQIGFLAAGAELDRLDSILYLSQLIMWVTGVLLWSAQARKWKAMAEDRHQRWLDEIDAARWRP